MKKFHIEDLYDVVAFMYKKVHEDDVYGVSFVGFYDDVVLVLKRLLGIENVEIGMVNIEPEELDGYDREYTLTLFDNFEIWCDKSYDEENNRYLFDETSVLLLADDCSAEILSSFDAEDVYVVYYEEDSELPFVDVPDCNGDCEHCEFNVEDKDEVVDEKETSVSNSEYTNVSKNKDGQVTGFTKSWTTTDESGVTTYSSFSHMSSNEADVRKLAKDFGIKLD